MKNRILGARLSAVAVAVSGLAVSQFAVAQSQLKEVVVTANRTELALSDVVADVSIMDKAMIERVGGSKLTDVLARLPGVQTTTYGGSSVYIRGAEGRMTALYIDGVRVDSQDGLRLGGGAPWEMVPVSQIERIEILRGPASSIYGSDAMGGVIQVFTKRVQEGLSPFVAVEMGSFDTRKISTGLTGGQSGWEYALGLTHDSSNGFDAPANLIRTLPSRQHSGNARLGYHFNADQYLELQALDSQSNNRSIPWLGAAETVSVANLKTASLKWSAKWNALYSTRLSVTQSSVAVRDTSPNDYRTEAKGVLLENNIQLGKGLFSAVIEQKKDEFKAAATTWDPAFQGARTQDALALSYGVTSDKHSLQVSARTDNDSLFGSKTTGSAAYALTLSPAWKLRAATGTGYRTPTLEQIHGPYGSKQLTPETSRNHEFGTRYQSMGSSFNATMYRNVFENLISSNIALTTCAAGFFCYYNVGKASVTGFSLSGTTRLDAYNLGASMDWLNPVNDITGKQLSLRARKLMTLSADRQWSGWNVGAEVQAVGARFNNAANTVELGGYGLLNLRASTNITNDWKAIVRMDNVADKQYEQVGSFAVPGRAVNVMFKWQPAN